MIHGLRYCLARNKEISSRRSFSPKQEASPTSVYICNRRANSDDLAGPTCFHAMQAGGILGYSLMLQSAEPVGASLRSLGNSMFVLSLGARSPFPMMLVQLQVQ